MISVTWLGTFGSASDVLGAPSRLASATGNDSSLSAERSDLTTPRSPKHSKVPLSFEPNSGQTDSRVRFFSRGANYVLFLADREAVLVFGNPHPKIENQHSSLSRVGSPSAASFRIRLAGARAAAEASGLDELPGKSNY